MDPLRSRFRAWLDEETRVTDTELAQMAARIGRARARSRVPRLVLATSAVVAVIAFVSLRHGRAPSGPLQIVLRVDGEPADRALQIVVAEVTP